jgi:K+-sensing histidine kinase KdpD
LKPEELPVNRAARGETVRDAVISVRRPDAPVRYLRCNAVPLTGPEGGAGGAIVLVADITAEQAAVNRQDSIRSLLLDTVNHELRTPLTVVLANAELIIDAADDLPEYLGGPLSAIVRASGRLRDTVQHVSDLVDLEAVAHPVRSETNIHELLLAVADRHRDHAHTLSVSVELDCPSPLNWNLDASLVKRAVAALLDNALAYGPKRNKITMAADVVDDLLRVRVIDGGRGIPIHDQARLTKPFERGTTAAHHAQHSRGLGLPLAHAVATSHHGTLSLTNDQPNGFTACLMLA